MKNSNNKRYLKTLKRKRKKEKSKIKPKNNLNEKFDSILKMISSGNQENRQKRSESFSLAVEKVKDILGSYDLREVAYSILLLQLWLPNIASGIKFALISGILTTIDENPKPLGLLSNYDNFHKFCTDLIGVLPSFPSVEDYVPEPDWGCIRKSYQGKNYQIFYGCNIERIYDYISAFEISICSLSEYYQAKFHEDPKDDLRQALQLQHIIINSLATQPLNENFESRIEPGYIEVPDKVFWSEGARSLVSIVETTDLTDGFLEKYSIAASENHALDVNESFIDEIFNDNWLPYLFLRVGEEYIPLNPRNINEIIFSRWFKTTKGVQSEEIPYSNITRSLQNYLRTRLNSEDDGIFEEIIVGNTTTEKSTISFDALLVEKSKLLLVKVLNNYHADNKILEKYAVLENVVINSLKSRPSPIFYLPDRKAWLELQLASKANSSEIKFVYLIPVNSFQMNSIRIPKNLDGDVFPLDSFLGAVDSLRSSRKIFDYFEFMENHRGVIGPFAGAADMLGAYVDSLGILEAGAIEYNMIGLDPHWGSNYRYKKLEERFKSFPETFPDDSVDSWIVNDESSQPLLQRTDKPILATHIKWESADLFTLADYSDLNPPEGRMMEVMQECIVDTIKERCEILNSFGVIPHYKKITVNLEVGLPMPTPNDIHSSELDLNNNYVFSLINKNIISEALNLTLSVNFVKVAKSLKDATDASFEALVLKELLVYIAADCDANKFNSVIQAIDCSSNNKPRFYLGTHEEIIPFPQFIDISEPTKMHFKLAKKEIALLVKALGVVAGRFELSEAKAILNKIRLTAVQNLNAKLKEFDIRTSVPVVLEKIEALLDKEMKSKLHIKQSLAHDVNYDRAKRLGESQESFLRNHRNYRYLVEKLIELNPSGDKELTSDEFKAVIAAIDWLLVIYGASDSLHYGIHPLALVIDSDLTLTVEYDGNIESQEEKFRIDSSENYLNIRGNPNDIVEYKGGAEEIVTMINPVMMQEIGFKLTSLLVTLETLHEWPTILSLDNPKTFYKASKEEIVANVIGNFSEVSSEEVEKVLDYLTLTQQGLMFLSGESQICSDIPVWEHTKRQQRFTINPLIMIGNEYCWGAYSALRAKSIWQGNLTSGTLPTTYKLAKSNAVIDTIKKSIESQLVVRAYEVVKRFTSYAEKELYLDKRFPLSNFPSDLGDYDVLAYIEATNTLISIECKDNSPPYCLKDSKRLQRTIFGNNANETSHLSKIIKRHNNLVSNTQNILTLLKWPVDKIHSLRIISIYLSRRTYWWFRYPPYETNVTFVQIDELEDLLKTLS